jgi:hypothetical protein
MVNGTPDIKKPDAVKLYRAVLLYGGAVGIESPLQLLDT